MEIKANPNGTQNGVRTAECDLWDQVSYHTPCSSQSAVNNVNFNKLDIYPNPSTGKFYINAENQDISLVKVYNSLGELVYSSKNTNTINLQHLQRGFYYITSIIQGNRFSAVIWLIG